MKAKLSFLIALMLLTACKPLARHFLVTEPFSPKGLIRGRNGSHHSPDRGDSSVERRGFVFPKPRRGERLVKYDKNTLSIYE